VKKLQTSKKTSNKQLYFDIKALIEQSRQQAAVAVNAAISMLYWSIGKRINEEILKHNRAEYGRQVIMSLSDRLINEYGRGWDDKTIRHCIKFAEVFPKTQIVSTVWRQLSWSHIKALLYIDEPLKREFYIQMAINEKWSVRTLRERINSMLYERTAISKKPEVTIEQDLKALKTEAKMSPDLVFRDPYFLGFLGLSDKHSEKDLETAIIVELQNFITELGSDFAFVARQKRITIDDTDYYIDLLFYHRKLRCLVAVDLKIGKFKAAYKGQMELYLRYLQKYEQRDGENSPIGLILCAGKNKEHIELMQLDKSNIKVAQYLISLPNKKLLEAKLHKAIEIAQSRISSKD
jgi:predicted nuclease of restriction endonuclease-like (RecB) superfamily